MKKKLFYTNGRVTSILLCLLMIFTSVSSFGQSKIKVDFQDAPLSKVLESISKQSDYRFVYTNELKVDQIRVSIKSDNEPATSLFSRLFNQANISYVIKNNQVILGVKQAVAATKTVPAKVVTGVIKEEASGEVLPGVTIQNVTEKKVVYSDIDGNYSISVKPGDVLLFSLIGMVDEKVNVMPATKVLNIALKTDLIALEDVVVTGYQTLSKERSTGSFSVVTAQKIENKLQPSIKSILEGQSAGVVLTKDGNIEIRGVSTINGVKEPLIVVDGYPLIGDGVGLESINPDNIENITILKDAVAASIYGARASNGVIVVTTKSPEKGSFNVSYKGTYGIALKPQLSKLNMASVEDYMDAELDLYNQNPNSYYSSYSSYSKISDYAYLLMAKERGLMSVSEADAQIAALRNNNALQQIQDNLIRPAQSQQHNIALSGGTEKNMFNGVIRYSKEYENVIKNDNSRVIVDLNNTWKPKDWFTLRIISNINYSEDNATNETYSSLTSFASSNKILPYTQLYDNNGNATPWTPVGQRRLETYADPEMKSVLYHPETDMGLQTIQSERLQVRLGGDITVKFCDFLTGSVGGSWITGSTKSRTIADGESFMMRTAYNDGTSVSNPSKHYIPEGGKIDENRGTIDSWVIRAQLNYKQSFNNDKHRISAMFGSEINKDTYEYSYMATRLGYNPVSATWNSGFDPYEYNNNRDNVAGDMLFGRKPANLGTISYGKNYAVRDNRFASWYGNASYEFNNKYLVSGSVRLDLTNFFGTDPKFRYKPTWSVGATYKIAEEPFFEGLRDIFDLVNLRASYGVNGNISLNNTPFMILSVGSYNATMGGVSYGINSYPNNQLRWERTLTVDIGLDIAMFKNRLNIGFDFYNKKSKDLIANDAVDETRGTASLPQNVGELSNRGFELSINGDVVRNKDFAFNSSLIASYNTSNVDYYSVKRAYFTSYATANGILVQDYPMDGLWGSRFAGLNDKGAALFYNAAGEKVEGGSLKADDAVYLGTLRPKLDMSWTNTFRYKNIEASFMFIAKFGNKYRKDAFTGSNYTNRHVGERWREPGDEANTIYPVLKSWNMDMFYFPYSDVLIGNANYVKLRDLTLSYYLPKKIVHKIGLKNLKVYFQTRNLFYITAKGVDIDPEVAQLNTSGGTGAMTNQGFTSLQLRPEFFFGLSVNL